MADGSIGIRTYRDNETRIQIVNGGDGVSATNKLSIQKVGDAIVGGTNDFGIPVFGKDVSGNYKLLDFTADGLQVDPGTVTVEATALDIRQLEHDSGSPDSIQVGDGTEVLLIDSDGQANVSITDAQAAVGATAPLELVQIGGVDPSGNAKSFTVNTDGSINAVLVDNPDQSQVFAYSDFGGDGVANGVTENFDYVVTNTKTFLGEKLLVSADGKILVEIGTWDGVSSYVPFLAYFQQPSITTEIDIGNLTLLGDGTKTIRVRVTGKTGQSSEVYATIQGIEK